MSKKFLQIIQPIDENCAKNEMEYQEKKRKKQFRKMLIFISFSAIMLAIFIFAFIANAAFDYSSDIATFFRINILHNDGPAILQSVILIAVGYIIITVLYFLIKLLTRGGGKRQKTLATLAASFVKYIGYIIILVLLFNVWDLDAAILAAVLAALGIALGFGAQGLISDLLAGIFLIFENSLQVGDVITFNNYRGEVEEIGIRTTKIRHINGNVKVINNSELKVFVNMTLHRSMAVCELIIEYGENVERVEKIINEHLLVLQNKYEEVISEGPYYKGLKEFNEKGVVLLIVAKCYELDRMQLERNFNREFKLLFDEHNIRLAVPKIEIRENQSK